MWLVLAELRFRFPAAPLYALWREQSLQRQPISYRPHHHWLMLQSLHLFVPCVPELGVYALHVV
ncbi:Uncharacterised protein [Vibrio cholerae]|nr:Uncharacterised protein [Vibrio cholerae]